MVRKRLFRLRAILLALLVSGALVAVTAAPAEAVSGGGCRGGTITACISYNAPYIVGDAYFYGDTEACGHTVEIYDSFGRRMAYQGYRYCNYGWNPGVIWVPDHHGTYETVACFDNYGCNYSYWLYY
ncbi:MAG: hypothetical protein HOV77_02320 [Hamadaea sp.]|uniref:hypothetical protein n=1 Tax=Hamadaea sp. TaxID=2024425 RepID=UPI00183E3D38|nr:hypothetical protein [Hamadaea sp.]NUT17993.1 hypothetical protein [Hamadaea sp.]